MCCIFTCCGWMVDLVQRAWVFTMSCCISSAVCCVFFFSSMSGVALGYNYSLAEYIDMKETNVSVYLKRGIFDDDANDDDLTWRRSGRKSLKGHVRDDGDLLTAATPIEPEQVPQSGRRLDDTILESDNRNNFEGSLMKLTAKAPFPSTTVSPITSDLEMQQVASSYPAGSLDQLKAIQGIINARKSAAGRDPADKQANPPSTYGYDDRYLHHFPGLPSDPQSRRMMAMMDGPGPDRPEVAELKPPSISPMGPYINPARFAVPSDVSGEHWWLPRSKPEVYKRVMDTDDDLPPFPKPVTYRTGPIRPTEEPVNEYSTMPAALPDQKLLVIKKIEDLASTISAEKYSREENKLTTKPGPMIVGNDNMDYYEDAMKGLPVRKRRSINTMTTSMPVKQVFSKAMPQKDNPALFAKFKVRKSASNTITDYPSILASKLHFSNNALSNKTTPTNENGENNATKTIGVTTKQLTTLLV